MKDLLLLILLTLAFTFVISSVFSTLAFLIDVCKWHLMEKKIIVKASKEREVNPDERDNNRSSERGTDRSSNGTDAGSSDGDSYRDSGSGSSPGPGTETESRECDSRSLFNSWLQP